MDTNKSQAPHPETIIFKTQIHWIIFFFPTLITFACIFFIFRQSMLFLLNYAAIALIVYFLGDAFIRYVTTTFTLTNEQLIIRRGLIFTQTWSIPLKQIESTELIQSLPGKMLDYGNLFVNKTGGNVNVLNDLDQAVKFRTLMTQAMEKLYNE